MIYIRKKRTPKLIKEKAKEIIDDPSNGYSEITLPTDSNKLRCLFDSMPKDEIRNALFLEQHGLCAYCMRKITPAGDSMKIEHYSPLSKDKNRALDYQNYLGVCYGGEKDDAEKPKVFCCDTARKDKALTISPWNSRQMDAIGYYRDGQIFVKKDMGLDAELTKEMQDDIDNVLCLNGIKDAAGKTIRDTASQLVAGRRATYASVHSQFERWANHNCLTVDFLQDKIDELEKQLTEDNFALPYIGVRLYAYKRKQKKLSKQCKR